MTPHLENVSLTRVTNLRGRDITPIPTEGGARYLVPLTRGLFATIDACDLNKVYGLSWIVHKGSRGNMYARAYIKQLESGTNIHIYMHRHVMGVTDPAIEVDHESPNDTLDNTRDNLRVADDSQQQCNSQRPKSKYGFRGVARDANGRGSYYGFVDLKGTRHRSGGHKTPESAARARDRMAIVLHGDFATLNFPRADYCEVAV